MALPCQEKYKLVGLPKRKEVGSWTLGTVLNNLSISEHATVEEKCILIF